MMKRLPQALAILLLSAAGMAHAAPDGSALFAQHCAACHQADGSGTVGLAPTLKGEHWKRLGAERGYLLAVLTHGLSGAIPIGKTQFVGSMPAFAGPLDDEALAAIATHLRGLQGAADEPAYTAAEVAAARQAPGGPTQTRQRRAQLLGATGTGR